MEETDVKQVAIIGATASGKSALSLELAKNHNAMILSLDSLAIYREIDIASAKPGRTERQSIPHFGINVLAPDEMFDVTCFIELYREARQRSLEESRPLIVVGGSSFYLKTLLDGISPLPKLDERNLTRLNELMSNPINAYTILKTSDPTYAARIASTDRYRIEKGLHIFLATGIPPSEHFRRSPPQSVITDPLPLYEIVRERDELRHRIRLRTEKMLSAGLLDEVAGLELRYGRAPNPMKAIGIREVLDYFDGRLDRRELKEKIIINTARLAKRQETFNRSQFDSVLRGDTDTLKKKIEEFLQE